MTVGGAMPRQMSPSYIRKVTEQPTARQEAVFLQALYFSSCLQVPGTLIPASPSPLSAAEKRLPRARKPNKTRAWHPLPSTSSQMTRDFCLHVSSSLQGRRIGVPIENHFWAALYILRQRSAILVQTLQPRSQTQDV